MGIRCADHVTPLYSQKLALTSPTGGGRSVGIVRSRTKATEVFFNAENADLAVVHLSLGFERVNVLPLNSGSRKMSLSFWFPYHNFKTAYNIFSHATCPAVTVFPSFDGFHNVRMIGKVK